MARLTVLFIPPQFTEVAKDVAAARMGVVGAAAGLAC